MGDRWFLHFFQFHGILRKPSGFLSLLDKTDLRPHFSASVRSILYIFLFFVLRAAAADSVSSSELVVRVWQSQDGLPSNVVRSVVQGSDSYLWLATAEGVARFDGYEFQVIEPEGELRRQRFAFSRLFATGGGQIWAATYQSGLFRVEHGRLREVLENLRTPNQPLVSQLIQNARGEVFFKRGSEISQVLADGSVIQVSPGEELLQALDEDQERQISGGRAVDVDGPPILRDRMGRTWQAGVDGGLTVAAEGEVAIAVELPVRTQAYRVNELMEDTEGNVWVATPGNGLVRVHHARVHVVDTHQAQNDLAVWALLEDRSGAWWIANRRGGVNRWRPGETSRYVPLSAARSASAFFEDRDSRLWVASGGGSVYCLINGVLKPQFSKTQVPSKVRAITQDSKGTLWFGGSQGLVSYSDETVRRYGREDGIVDNDLSVLQPFPGGMVIAGSASGRILLGNDDGFKTIASPELVKHQWISGILPVTARETWAATLGSGLYLWDGGKWTCFDANDGLPDSRLTSVLEDGRGGLWLGSLGGIVRAERRELLAHARDSNNAVKWLRLDHTDGMPSRECIGGYQPSGWKSADGSLWFPTGGGIARVRPGLVVSNKVAPPVYLQKARANGILHSGPKGPLLTSPGRARLEFHFVGLSLSAPEKVTYRARLSGLSETWRELGTQRVAAYEAVPPGEYTFEVVAVNGDGLRSLAPASIPVIIKPNFWETAWFSISIGGLILAVAVGIGWLAARRRLKERIQALKVRTARESERSRIARDLHDDLGAGLTEISILAALAAEDAVASPLQTPLQQLSIKAKHAVGSLDEIVWAVNPREDTLRSLVDYIAAFAREFLDIASIPLRLDVAREIPEHPLSTSERHSIFLTVREALNNIVKHSRASEVMLRITLEDSLLAIRIEDNGRGFEPDYAEGGNGLENLRQRMRDVCGDCQIETRRGHGTTVFVTLPLLAESKPAS